MQARIIFLIHTLAYLLLFLQADIEIRGRLAGLYLAQVLFLAAYLKLYPLSCKHISRVLLNNMCVMLSIGMVMLTRISMDKSEPLAMAFRQFAWILLAALVTWPVPLIMNRAWQLSKIPWVYGITGLVLLLAVCIAGNTTYGARLSLDLFGISVQPSEIVKIIFVFFAAAMFYRGTDKKTIAITTAAAAAHVLLLAGSRDLGGAFQFFITYLCMLFVATSRWLYMGLGLGGGMAAAVFSYKMFSHVQVRVEAWLNPWTDIDKKGYQITQSLFAMGTGGWIGMGLYQGMPYKIPVVEKDFIFAAIVEELGGIFGVCLVLICLGCFLQMMMLAGKMQASFYKLIVFGLGMMYIVQVFLNIGGVIKFIPSTGVTLPLISYGGSSMLSTFLLFGVVQGLFMLKKNDEEDHGEETRIQ